MTAPSSAVNALIMGTQKGGTTALFEFVAEHPGISTPPREQKELHFFDDEAQFAQGRPDYASYEARFVPRPDALVRVEATPIYMWWLPAAPRIAAYNPGMKLIMILRDPVERAISQWEMEYSRRTETELFDVALERERELIRRSEQHRIRSYVDRGFYAAQVRRLLQWFPLRQMLFLRREDLLARHEATLEQVYDFLAVERPASYPAPRMVYPTEKARVLPQVGEGMRARLRGIFAEDLRELKRLTGLDTGPWSAA